MSVRLRFADGVETVSRGANGRGKWHYGPSGVVSWKALRRPGGLSGGESAAIDVAGTPVNQGVEELPVRVADAGCAGWRIPADGTKTCQPEPAWRSQEWTRKGCSSSWRKVKPEAEAAFNRWYNEDHLPKAPERFPGVISGRRYQIVEGEAAGRPDQGPRRRLTASPRCSAALRVWAGRPLPRLSISRNGMLRMNSMPIIQNTSL